MGEHTCVLYCTSCRAVTWSHGLGSLAHLRIVVVDVHGRRLFRLLSAQDVSDVILDLIEDDVGRGNDVVDVEDSAVVVRLCGERGAVSEASSVRVVGG